MGFSIGTGNNTQRAPRRLRRRETIQLLLIHGHLFYDAGSIIVSNNCPSISVHSLDLVIRLLPVRALRYQRHQPLHPAYLNIEQIVGCREKGTGEGRR